MTHRITFRISCLDNMFLGEAPHHFGRLWRPRPQEFFTDEYQPRRFGHLHDHPRR